MRITDYKPTVTEVVATAVRPDGTPALFPTNIPAWDYRKVTSYTNGNPNEIVYRKGGASGTIVCTQTLTWLAGGLLDTETLAY